VSVALLVVPCGLIIGINNERSIAAGCAKAFARNGMRMAATYYKDKNRLYLESQRHHLKLDEILLLDVRDDAQLDAVFYAMRQRWGKLDFLLHSIAFAPKDDLHGRTVDCSRTGWAEAMDVSVHSLIRMARHAEALMPDGGSILTVSYYGGERVVPHYNMMGPVKAALEGTVKYLAAELGPRGIRVNALSPGPILTRAASGIADFDELIVATRERAPEHEAVTIDDVGAMAAFLVSDAARHITGNVMYIDSGYHVMG